MVEQRPGRRDAAPWVLEGGRRLPGRDDNRRLAALRRGLLRHARVRAIGADACDEQVGLALGALHEPSYLHALRQVCSDEPVVLPALAPPGLAPDIPVRAGLVAAAHEAVRTGITAATRLAQGARFTYALCRPPGHHAGPGWLAGYCYLNTAAAAVWTLHESGVRPVGVLDLDLHYPNGTAAILAPMADAHLHSVHAFPVTNVPALTVSPHSDREHVVELAGSPSVEVYLDAVSTSIDALARSSPRAGCVAWLRHGRGRPPRIVEPSPVDLCADRPPVGVLWPAGVRDPGGWLRAAHAGGLQRRVRHGPARGSSGVNGLDPFRRRLDALDEELARLLGERFEVCREIARYKQAHDIPMMQPDRVAEVRARYLARGADVDLPSDFTAALFELLIGATCKMEDELIAASPRAEA